MNIASFLTRIKTAYCRRIKKNETSPADVMAAENAFYSQYIATGMTIFDVGANVGEVSRLFSQLIGEEGTVHAFEPSIETYRQLTKNVDVENLSNVIINNIALSDKTGTAKFHVYGTENSTLNSLADRPLKDYGIDVEGTIEEVSTTTVDAYCQENRINSIDLLKIDVEGAELEVLRGAERMMQNKHVRCCIFEFGQTIFDMGTDPQDIKDFFKQNDYQLRNLIDKDPVFPGGEQVNTAQFSMHVAEPNFR